MWAEEDSTLVLLSFLANAPQSKPLLPTLLSFLLWSSQGSAQHCKLMPHPLPPSAFPAPFPLLALPPPPPSRKSLSFPSLSWLLLRRPGRVGRTKSRAARRQQADSGGLVGKGSASRVFPCPEPFFGTEREAGFSAVVEGSLPLTSQSAVGWHFWEV